MSGKKVYVKPVLDYCGKVSERTLGNNGYNCDPSGHSPTKNGNGYGLCDE